MDDPCKVEISNESVYLNHVPLGWWKLIRGWYKLELLCYYVDNLDSDGVLLGYLDLA